MTGGTREQSVHETLLMYPSGPWVAPSCLNPLTLHYLFCMDGDHQPCMVFEKVIYLAVYIDGGPQVSDPVDEANTSTGKQTLIHYQRVE